MDEAVSNALKVAVEREYGAKAHCIGMVPVENAPAFLSPSPLPVYIFRLLGPTNATFAYSWICFFPWLRYPRVYTELHLGDVRSASDAVLETLGKVTYQPASFEYAHRLVWHDPRTAVTRRPFQFGRT